MTAFHGTDNLRLEVETAPTGLPNLVKNPNGALGAWGYVTSVANTVLTSSGTTLTFQTLVSQDAFFGTEFLAATPGSYVAARVDFASMTASHNARLAFNFYDATKTFISSSSLTAGFGAGTGFLPSIVVPAGAAYVRLSFGLYSGTGTANAAANAQLTFSKVMVTWASTSAGLGSTRKNLVQNPSIETTDTNTFVPYASRTRVNTAAAVGSYSVRVYDGGGQLQNQWVDPIVGGKDYAIQLRALSGSSARVVKVMVWWSTSTGTFISEQIVGSATDNTSTWTKVSGVLTAPSNAASMFVLVEILGGTGSGAHYLDALMVEQSSTVGDYFDGSTTATGKTYQWSGTAHQSSSQETTSGTFAYSDPITWRNILGPTHSIDIDRHALDVGTMSANIVDALLDPAVSGDLAPGKAIRALALVGTVWESLFEGRLDDADVSYVWDSRNKLRTSITLSATDNIAILANQGEARGVANVADLPYVLEGKGVPWRVNGSGNQVASAAVVSSNENASTLDQIALTRDSTSGYAWVDRFNVASAYDKTQMPTAIDVYFTDAASALTTREGYSAIDAGYNTDDVINQVVITWLRTTPTGETEEITYGPYSDAASIATYGARQKTFTMHGATENASTIAAFAASTIAANKTPTRRVSNLTMPVKSPRSLAHAAKLDLYAFANVTFGTVIAGISYRVTSIKHSITTDKWLVDYGFSVDGAVASPSTQPSPIGTGDVTDGTWSNVGATGAPPYLNGWSAYPGWLPTRLMRKDGIVYVQLMAKGGTNNQPIFTIPPGYRPAGELAVQPVIVSGAPQGMLYVSSNGNVYTYGATSNTYIGALFSFPAEA